MAIIGTATLNVVPKITNVSAALDKAFAGAGATYGQQLGNQVTSGFKQSVAGGAIIGAFSQVTSMALSGISSSVSSAVNRLDTLKNYPRVMDSLGYSTDEVAASLSTMDSHLQGLPTALNTMTSTVQGLAAITGDLTLATDAGLALNDMLLAGGGNMQVAASAGEQFRQMLSKGKPDMQDWKSIMAAAPGQMNQLAESMLGAGASASDLYYALGGGSESDVHMEGIEHASVSMTDLLNAIVKLDQEGGDGIASFADQAKNATGGIQTSMANLQNAITRGLANVFDAIGQDRIREAIEWVKGGINTAFTAVKNVVSAVMPVLDALAPAFKAAVPGVLAFGAAFKVFTGVAGKLPAIANKASDVLFNMAANASSPKLQNGLLNASTGMAGMGSAATKLARGVPIAAAAIGGAVAVVTLITEVINEATKEFREHQEAIDKLAKANDEFAATGNVVDTALGRTKAGLEDVRAVAERSSDSLNELAESQSAAAESIKNTDSNAQASIGQLDAAKRTIEELGGQTNLTSEQYGALTAALDTVNKQCGTHYSIVSDGTGIIADETGAIIDNKDAIYDYIDARKEQIRFEALSSNLETYYKQQADAASAMISQQRDLSDYEKQYADDISKVQYYIDNGLDQRGLEQDVLEHYSNWKLLKDGVDAATESYDVATDAIDTTMGQMGMATQAAADEADSLEGFVHSHELFFGNLRDGLSADVMIQQMKDLGITQEQLAGLTDSQLRDLVASYNGSADDIVTAMENIEGESHNVADAVNNIPDSANTNVSATGASETISAIDRVKAKLDEITGKTFRFGIQGVFEGITNYMFGNASGAFIQEHASGAYIVDQPTVVSTAGGIHIAGEAGAELVDRSDGNTAILPIEKSQYVNRFGAAVGRYLNNSARSAPNIVMYNTQREGESVDAFAQRVAQELKWRL